MEEYQRKAEILTKLAHKWGDAQLIRDFALAFAKASSQLCRTEAGKREAEVFYVSAMEYADSLDPLSFVQDVITKLRYAGLKHGF